MISLNILPENYKASLKLSKNYAKVKKYIVSYSVLLGIIFILFFVGKMWLRGELTRLDKLIEAKKSEGGSIAQKVQELNQKLTNFESIQKKFSPLSPMIFSVINSIPSNVSLDSMEVVRSVDEKNTILFTGAAKTRDDFLKFEDNLKSLDFIESIESPLENLFTRENVKFTIEMNIK